jgi:MFS family permease
MTWTAAARGALLIGSETNFRGRVLALYSAMLGSGATFGAFVGGAVGESLGARWILITGSLSCLIVPWISAGLFMRYRK